MKQYQILENDIQESFLFSSWNNLIIKKNIYEVENHIPLIIGGDILRQDVRDRLELQHPTIFIHRGSLGNHLYKQRHWWRYSINSFANTELREIPYSRWNLLRLPKHPWKVKKVNRVLIAPSKMTASTWDPENGFNWAENVSRKFSGAEVKIRIKGRTPGLRWSTLWDDLDWADLVVSQASAITVEAFWYGKKVISLYPCNTWAAGTDSTLDNWQDPAEPPQRDVWHEHLAWSQFSNQEWSSGEALDLIDLYIGDIRTYNPRYRYDFKNS